MDGSGNVYVADTDYNAVVRWAPGATSGVTVAGTATDNFDHPEGVAVDGSGNVYVADTGNDRVRRWAPGATFGVTVAGGNGEGSGDNQVVNPNTVAVDGSGNVYVSDFSNDRVQRWAPGATAGITVAGGTYGSAANQLAVPGGVAVDGSGNLYVTDVRNYRVQRWAPGATAGVTVAGGNGYGSAANQLASPAGVAVDDAGNVYVGDTDNARVQRWAPGATSGVTVAGGNGDGSAANQFDRICGIAVDHSGNTYIADQFNNRVQRWSPVPATLVPGNGIVAAPASGMADLNVSVTLNTASLTAVSASWTTLNVRGAPTSPIIGPQAPPSDYTASSGVVTFAPGQTAAPVTIPVNGDSTGADYEYVVVSFHDPTGAKMGGFWGLGFGVIESATHAALPTVIPGTGTVAIPKSATVPLDVPVTLGTPSATAVTVQWNTLYLPDAPNTANGSEAPPADYTAASGIVTFGPGQTIAHVTISVSSDSTVNFNSEYVYVSFHDPTGAKMGGNWGLGTGVIAHG